MPLTEKGEDFTCELCGETYKAAVEHVDAAAEFAKIFPGEPLDDAAVVCDDCFKNMVTQVPPELFKELEASVDVFVKDMARKIVKDLMEGDDGE